MKIKSHILFLFFCFCYVNIFPQGVWTQKANFGGTADIAEGFSIGTKGYIVTADTASDFWEWDQANNVWTQKANFGGTARGDAIGFSIGNKGYIGSGEGGSGPFIYYNDFWEWDKANNIWTQKASFGATPRVSAAGFSIGTKGYIGTGAYFNGSVWVFYKDFWEWDQASNVWTQKANFGGTARNAAVGFSIGTKGYIGTGLDVNGNKDDFWEWDQTTNIWTQKANFAGTARPSAVGFSIGTRGYIGTGAYNTTYYNDFWEWNQATNIWTQKANFGGTARYGAAGFSIGTKGYIGVGNDGNGVKNDFWEYCDTCALGVNEVDLSNLISVYPNPTNRAVTVTIGIGSSSAQVQGDIAIYNLQGEKIYQSSNLKIFKSTIDLSSQPNGIYFIKIQTSTGEGIKKLIIQK